ncbi:dTMP kinase [bacterium]|nr:dTMP kinase [bacterium]MBU1065932.1 dTMP kinase [bacterium]MBU1635647.1 dTMP kinase [bacterium]MBU1872373.1 dTMP kinase [bacterium]
MKSGIFITFEGIDGSGKTTQITALIQHLDEAGIPYQLFREPGGTGIGEKVRDILLDKNNDSMLSMTELLLYSASRYQLTKSQIIPALESGKVVICDRFYDSSTAYQGYGRGIDLDFIMRLNAAATDSLVPDKTFILDISLEERHLRLDNKNLDRLEQEALDFHKRVHDGFLKMAAIEPERFIVLEGNRNPEELSNEIWETVKTLKELINK